jgi:hypothetical protein
MCVTNPFFDFQQYISLSMKDSPLIAGSSMSLISITLFFDSAVFFRFTVANAISAS